MYSCLYAIKGLVCILRSDLTTTDSIIFLGGDDDRALVGDSVIPFMSPPTLQREFVLPNSGKICGMLIPKGVTVITGKIKHYILQGQYFQKVFGITIDNTDRQLFTYSQIAHICIVFNNHIIK